MDFNQGELDFNQPNDGTGYKKWQEDLDLRKKEFESRYSSWEPGGQRRS